MNTLEYEQAVKDAQICNVYQFDYAWFKKISIEKLKRGNNGSLRNRTRNFKDLISAFDIETSKIYCRWHGGKRVYLSKKEYKKLDEKERENVEIHSFMYIWMWHFEGKCTVVGRTWDEFQYFTKQLADCLGESEKLVVYVHNLSFEFQFLRGIYPFTKEEIFAIDKRHILKCTMHNQAIEFRCSYKLTNMSLDKFTSKMNVQHKKLNGALNYNLIRLGTTKLTIQELAYCVNDVVGLVEAIRYKMKMDNDTITSIPMTSTGYVRRDCKRAMRPYRYYIQDIFPSLEVYEMIREEFRGGDTHASRFYAGRTIEDVKSADRSSSYPDVMANMLFPISKFFVYKEQKTIHDVIDLMNRRKKAVLCRVALHKVRLQDQFWGCPYISKSKCRNIENGVYDNGRVLSADYLETTITDVDLRILLDEYDFDDIVVIKCAYANYGKLPKELVSTIQSYYKAKTELKDVEGEEYFYSKMKELLNAIYGMCAQNPLIETLEYDGFEFKVDDSITNEQLLLQYKRTAFIVYQWGAWTTGWARYWLHRGIRAVGDDFVYCDTDSVKYVGDHEADFEKLNEELRAASAHSGSYATDKKGITHYMGEFENDGKYRKFKTLGAKKYIYQDYKTTDIHITIAGVVKSKGGDELVKRRRGQRKKPDGFENFKPGFIFVDAGGKDIVYNDLREGFTVKYRGHDIYITSNSSIIESTYKLGIEAEYERLLKDSEKLLQAMKNRDILDLGRSRIV